MRVALISICETCDDGSHQPLALLPLADGTLAQYQIRLAIDAGAQKIVVFIQVVAGQVMRLQEYAERNGAEFVLVRSVAEIRSHIAAEDDILVIADGLYVRPDIAASIWNRQQPNFATFSAGEDTRRLRGYERVDINHYWAGLAKLKGRDLLALASLPGDWSMESAALRSAVQQEYPRIMLSDKMLGEGSVSLQSGTASIETAQKEAVFGGEAEGRAFTERFFLKPAAKWIAPIIWRRSKGQLTLSIAQLATLLLAPIASYYGHVSAGFAMLLVALFSGYVQRQIYGLFEIGVQRDYYKYARLASALAVLFIGLLAERENLPVYLSAYLALQAVGIYWHFSRVSSRDKSSFKHIVSEPYLLLLAALFAAIPGYLLFACIAVSAVMTAALLIPQSSAKDKLAKIAEKQA